MNRRRAWTVVVAISTMLSFAVVVAGADPASGWSNPVRFDDDGQPQSVSCPTTAFCVAVDSNGTVFARRNGAWQAGVNLFGTGGFAGSFNSVSCTSATFCAAVSGTRAFIFNGSTWTAGTDIESISNPDLISVSCVSSTFCVAADQQYGTSNYNGATWTEIDYHTNMRVTAVSCSSTTFCTTVDFNGAVYTYNGATWRTTDSGSNFQDVSCASATFCVDTDINGNIKTWDGTGWSVPIDLSTTLALGPVSCASTSFCVTADAAGDVFVGT